MTTQQKILFQLKTELAQALKQEEKIDPQHIVEVEGARVKVNTLYEVIDIVQRIKDEDSELPENLVIAGIDFSEAITQLNNLTIRKA